MFSRPIFKGIKPDILQKYLRIARDESFKEQDRKNQDEVKQEEKEILEKEGIILAKPQKRKEVKEEPLVFGREL